MFYNASVASDTPASEQTPVLATTNIKLSPAEYAFLLRLRNLRNQAADGVIRLELNVNRDRVELVDARPIKREVFA